MANYVGRMRTNYFECKDPEALKRLCALATCEDKVEVWTVTDEEGIVKYGFGTRDTISGLTESARKAYRDGRGYLTDEERDEDDDEVSDLYFYEELQELVMPGDACIIMESGYEKLRYLVGDAVVITSEDIQYIRMTDKAKELARQMLNNPKYDTQMEY